MKKLLLVLTVFSLYHSGFAQHRLGFSASIDATDAFRFTSLEGDANVDGGIGYGFSLIYMFPLNTHWHLQTALAYRHAQHTIVVNAPPNELVPDREVQRNLISVPILFRRYFGSKPTKFYLDLGSSIAFENDVPEDLDDNSGLGLIFSPGIEKPLNGTFSLNLAPQFQMYAMVPFQKGNYHRRIFTAGIALSLFYSLY